jgi:hypothetical protein
MAKDWVSVAGTNAPLWGIPLTPVQELGDLTEAADAALVAAKNETTRTPVAAAQCKAAYFAVQIENERKKGLRGPLTQALIP